MKNLLVLVMLGTLSLTTFGQSQVKGKAFIDKNANGILDKGEKSYKDLNISNGRDIVTTDKNGNFSIEKLEDRFVFAIKPKGYQFGLDVDYQPRFYHASSAEEFTIPLVDNNESKQFSMVLMGDPQVYAQDQINYLGQVATDELRGADYEFMMVLGDLVGNMLPLLPKVKTTLGKTQKACYYAIGNHDRDRGPFDKPEIKDNDSFEKFYGPDYYSFNWGEAHFLVLNNVFTADRGNGKSDYVPGIHPMQLQFIENDLKKVPVEKLIVVCAHIPFFNETKKATQTQQMIALLKDYPNVFMATGHAHNQIQLFLGEKDGRTTQKPIHQLVAGAICGGWWRGETDIHDIPAAMMRDGTPQGYWFMHVDGNDYQLEYKASLRSKDKQMHIWVPEYKTMDTIMAPQKDDRDVWINVYAGNDSTNVKIRVDDGKWIRAEKRVENDPYILRLLERQERGITPTEGARPLKPEPRKSTHLWYTQIPEGLEKGAHVMEIQAIDKFGLDATAYRTFWVQE